MLFGQEWFDFELFKNSWLMNIYSNQQGYNVYSLVILIKGLNHVWNKEKSYTHSNHETLIDQVKRDRMRRLVGWGNEL